MANFVLSEFTCKCGCGQNLIKEDFVKRLNLTFKKLPFPLVVTSGYRCPSHNNKVSSTGFDGPHTTGRAADLACRGQEALQVVRYALEAGFTGIGVNQKGGSRFIHLDDLPNMGNSPRPWIWSY